MPKDLEVAKTIDITPTWEGVLPIFLAAYTQGTFEGRKAAQEELVRMARIADDAVATKKARDEAIKIVGGQPMVKGDTHRPHNAGDMWKAGITVGDHGNKVEVYDESREGVEALRDAIVAVYNAARED